MRTIVLVSITALLVGCSVSAPSSAVSSSSSNVANSSGDSPSSSSVASAAPAASPPVDAPAEKSGSAAPAGDAGRSEGGGSSAAAGANPVAIESGVATLSPENTRIQFVGTHVGAKPDPRIGVFTKFTGKIETDSEKKALKSVSLEISTESLETPIPQLTNHLRSQDFFDTHEFPTAKFQSSSIAPADGEGNFLITGSLTLLKATKELKIPVKVAVSDRGLTLTAEFTIDRTDFGMSGFQDKVNKEVPMTVSIGQPTAAK